MVSMAHEVSPAVPPTRRYPQTGAFGTGPPVGAPFPAMALPDQHGGAMPVSWGPGGRPTLVVFHRSARWCTFCRTQLLHLQHHLRAFEAAGVALVAISYDPPGALAEFAAENRITYPLLSDERSQLISRLGILNDLVRPDEEVYGIPYPGAYAVSSEGRVLRKYFYRHYRERPAPLGVLHEAFNANVSLHACLGADRHDGDVLVSARLADTALVPYQHTPLYVRVTAPETRSLEVTAEGLDVGAPEPSIVPGGAGWRVPLMLRSLDHASVVLTMRTTGRGAAPLDLRLHLPVLELRR